MKGAHHYGKKQNHKERLKEITEVQKPFMQEQELKDKTARLAILDRELNMSAMCSAAPSRDTAIVAKQARPSILDSLKQPPPKATAALKKSKSEREVR